MLFISLIAFHLDEKLLLRKESYARINGPHEII